MQVVYLYTLIHLEIYKVLYYIFDNFKQPMSENAQKSDFCLDNWMEKKMLGFSKNQGLKS